MTDRLDLPPKPNEPTQSNRNYVIGWTVVTFLFAAVFLWHVVAK